MVPIILDTVTGKTAKGDDFPVSWWTDGNGSCDCNRALAFDDGDDSGRCDGCRRYLVIDVEGDLEGCARAAIVYLANQDYSAELRWKALDENARRMWPNAAEQRN